MSVTYLLTITTSVFFQLDCKSITCIIISDKFLHHNTQDLIDYKISRSRNHRAIIAFVPSVAMAVTLLPSAGPVRDGHGPRRRHDVGHHHGRLRGRLW